MSGTPPSWACVQCGWLGNLGDECEICEKFSPARVFGYDEAVDVFSERDKAWLPGTVKRQEGTRCKVAYRCPDGSETQKVVDVEDGLLKIAAQRPRRNTSCIITSISGSSRTPASSQYLNAMMAEVDRRYLQNSLHTSPVAVAEGTPMWNAHVDILCKRFPDASKSAVVTALRQHRGHAGQAKRELQRRTGNGARTADCLLPEKSAATLQPPETMQLYHGTSLEAAIKIQAEGFRTELSGTNAGAALGVGLYCTTTLEKAINYSRFMPGAGVVFILKVELGRCYVPTAKDHHLMRTWQEHGYDSAWAAAGVLGVREVRPCPDTTPQYATCMQFVFDRSSLTCISLW